MNTMTVGLFTGLLFVFLFFAVGYDGSTTFYVATNGNDAWSGKLAVPNKEGTDGPFATLGRARDAVRALKKAQALKSPVKVLVRGGTYYLKGPLVFGPEDSGTVEAPIVYAAYPGEQVTLSGGRPITNWRKDKGDLWVADVPDVREGKWYFRQLFVNGERQVRARTPNFDPSHPTTGGWAFVQAFEEKGKEHGAFGDSLVRIHTPGDTFEWEIDVPVDGEYAFWMYYGANNKPFGNTDMAGRTTICIDDGAPIWLQNLPDTGGWGVFKWSKTAVLHLTKGKHRLRWKNVKGGGLNWDAFALCDDPNWEPKGTKLSAPAKGKHVVVVQAETFKSGHAREFGIQKGKRSVYKDRFHFRAGDIESWPRSPEPEIHIFPAWGWVNAILSIKRIDFENNVVYVTNRNCTQELRPGNRYFVENVFEALDTPGEWFLDRRKGLLYYWPKSKRFPNVDVVAPRLDRIVAFVGKADGDTTRFVEHITLRGFTFRHTKYSLEVPSVYTPDDGTIWLDRARHCCIENCKFLGVGGYGVRISSFSNQIKILRNTIEDAGEGGVLLVAPDTKTQPKRNVIAGNVIRRCGKIWKHVAGVYVTTGSNNRIAFNTVEDVPRYGISLKSFNANAVSHNNIVEYNKLVRTNLETNDTGAIETLGRDRQDSGNIIRHNLILDVVGLKTSPTGEMLTPFYTWGIYLDDYSSGTQVYGNIIARTVRGAIHVHLGRNNLFENNILIDGLDQQIEFNGGRFMANNVFRHNIVWFHKGALIRVGGWHDKVFAECDFNLYWNPGEDLNKSERGITPKGSLAQWREAGYDKHSLVADPLFAAPAKDDYRLQPNSPAFRLGCDFLTSQKALKVGADGYAE